MALWGNTGTPPTGDRYSEPASYQLGIDFGTSTTFVAYAVGQDDPQLLTFGRSTALPTALYYEESGGFDYGESAVNKGQKHPERLISRWKTRHEGGSGTVDVPDSKLQVEQLTCEFFRKIINRAHLRFHRDPTLIVATYPSYWDKTARASFRRALEPMPANVDFRCASEAACWAYNREGRISRNDLLAVYDFGASGIDVSWVRPTDRGFEAKAAVRAPGPNRTVGFSGNELDAFLLEQVRDRFSKLFDGKGREVPEIHIEQLRHGVNLAMAELGGGRDPVVEFPGMPNYQVRLPRAAVVRLIESRLDKSLDEAQLSLVSQFKDAPAPHHVLLLGGLMQLPAIRAKLNKRAHTFEHAETPHRGLIALGAANFPITPPPEPPKDDDPPPDPPIMIENLPEGRRWSPSLFAVGIVALLILSLVTLEVLHRQPLPLDDPPGRATATPPAGMPTPTPQNCPSSNASPSPLSQVLTAGEMIVPMSNARSSTVLFRVAVNGSCEMPRRIETYAEGSASNPALDRGRRHIIYLDEGNRTLRTVGVDGRNDHQLFDDPPRCGDVVRFSRDPTDDTRLAVICAPPTGTRKLFVMSTDGRIIRELRTGQAIIDDPNVSADGTSVAFWGSRDPSEDGGAILVMPMRGSKRLPRRITAGGGHGIDADPVWSKDGSIAFRRQRDGDYDIWIKPLQSAEVALVQGSFNDDRPNWSPDGASLAFVSDRRSDEDEGDTAELRIFIVAKDGTGLRGLQVSAYNVLAPTWGNR